LEKYSPVIGKKGKSCPFCNQCLRSDVFKERPITPYTARSCTGDKLIGKYSGMKPAMRGLAPGV
jgi:hypothetical protein